MTAILTARHDVRGAGNAQLRAGLSKPARGRQFQSQFANNLIRNAFSYFFFNICLLFGGVQACFLNEIQNKLLEP